jgi:serine/threonine protein kinase
VNLENQAVMAIHALSWVWHVSRLLRFLTMPILQLVRHSQPCLAGPEQVLADYAHAPRTPAADVYAYGVLLLEIMTGRPAFSGMTATTIRNAVLGGARPPLPDSRELQPCLAALIAACWAPVGEV